jgi:hypothetical protein
MNTVFADKNGNIEHVDLTYEEFKKLLHQLSDMAFEEGQNSK